MPQLRGNEPTLGLNNHERFGWTQLYETDPKFTSTYQILGENVVVDNFHI
jgi:hypothetical protein